MTPLQKDMIVSNELGYYEDLAFGIRIEVHTSTLYAYQNFNYAVYICGTLAISLLFIKLFIVRVYNCVVRY